MAPQYKGIETDYYDNNLLTELNLYKVFCADSILEDKYIVWINEKELGVLIQRGKITPSDISEDLGFCIAYVLRQEGETSAQIFSTEMLRLYYAVIETHLRHNPHTVTQFSQLIATNITNCVATYA